MQNSPFSLRQLIVAELTRPAPREALTLAAEVRHRHGPAVAAILFYGSCLRTQKVEGEVLDFYALVDAYRAVYSSRALAWMNAGLPPNVFYLEVTEGHRRLRAKYAVISTADFERAASFRSLHAIVWGRFCQPALLVYTRDKTARALTIRSLVESVITMVAHMVTLMPASGDTRQFRSANLWLRGFQETYRSELRAERPATIRRIYAAAPNRYDVAAREALRALEGRGVLHVHTKGDELHVRMSARHRRWMRLSWKVRRPVAKVLYSVRLLKSAVTFRDWLPYVFWKIGRHAGVPLEPTERQRRHPFLLGGLVILKLLLQRNLR